MSAETAIEIRELGDGWWQLEFPYQADFIAFLKSRVPAKCRTYDPDTNFWRIRDLGNTYMPAIEGVAAQKFTFATRVFKRNRDVVWRNLVSGHESVQTNLF